MGIGDQTVTVPLLLGEGWITEGFGCVGHLTGGTLIVTNQRLLFQPWDLGLAATLIKWGCKLLQVPHAGAVNYIVGRLVAMSDVTAQGVGGIVGVDAIGHASLFDTPKIRVTKDDGTVAEFGVVHRANAPSISPENDTARDALVSVLSQVFL
jgi:hypothetical protein